MGLLKGDVIKKINGVKAKIQKKKDELIEKRTLLLREQDMLRSAIEDDFQRQIMEEVPPDKKLKSDYDKVTSELGHLELQLDSLDGILSKELEKYKGDVVKESDKVVSDYGQLEKKMHDDLKRIKLQYFEKLIEYNQANLKARQQYGVHGEVLDSLGLKRRDALEKGIPFNTTQLWNADYQGMFTMEELREAYHGKMPYRAIQFKKENNL